MIQELISQLKTDPAALLLLTDKLKEDGKDEIVRELLLSISAVARCLTVKKIVDIVSCSKCGQNDNVVNVETRSESLDNGINFVCVDYMCEVCRADLVTVVCLPCVYHAYKDGAFMDTPESIDEIFVNGKDLKNNS
jgi:hypothetical protein